MRIRAVIVDDEPLARRRIRSLVKLDPDVEIVGEYGDGQSAVAGIAEHKPALLFLDVQMPELDGFGVLEAMSEGVMPVVIFVTAYDRYAVRAFESHALDYLLKPFKRERFRHALSRAKEQIQRQSEPDYKTRLAALLTKLKPDAQRLAIKCEGRTILLRVREIAWIEAERDYVRIHSGAQRYLVHETMRVMEAKLPKERFVRVHRSAIVNIDFVREIHPWFGGDQALILRDGTRLTLSRGHKEALQRLLDNPL